MDTLSWTIFFPLLTAAVVLIIPSAWRGLIKSVSLLGAVITLVLAIGLFSNYTPGEQTGAGSAQQVLTEVQERAISGASLGAEYQGADGVQKWKDAFLPAAGHIFSKEEYDQRHAAVIEAGSPEAGKAFVRCVELAYAKDVAAADHMTHVTFIEWIPSFNVNYFIGVDGLSLPLILLTAILCVICIGYSWTYDKGTKGFFALFLLLQSGLTGVFCSLDFFLFYVFWEVVLLPMYFLIGIWGGSNRLYAAIKFFIYTLVGSVLMLIVMLVMYFGSDPGTFNVLALMKLVPAFDAGYQWWMFFGLFIGFAIKVPVFPFHTWLPDAHVEAPTPVSVMLAGILLKMGGYGFFRFSYPMMPDAATDTFFIAMIAALGMINIVYGAFCALAQKDFKKLVAYSSVSHMGYVLLGLAALSYYGVTGSMLQMINHGVSSGMMFLLVGVVYDRAHHRDLTRFGGMGLQMPWYTGLAIIGCFASLGLPGLNGFISEFMCFFGSWDTSWTDPAATNYSLITAPADKHGIGSYWIIFVSLIGVVLTAAYILWTIQRVCLGNVTNEEYKKFPDVSFREVFALAPLGFLCIFLGVYPKYLIEYMDPTLRALTDMVRAALN